MPSEKKNVTLAALDSLWWGVSIGGKHYTGDLHHPGGTVQLIRKLSRREAKQLAHDDESRFWPTETNRFDTLAQLEAFALKWCEKNLSEPWLLLHNNTLNPTHVIGGRGYSKKRMEQLERYQKWWWSLTNAQRERFWRRGYAKWNRLLKPA